METHAIPLHIKAKDFTMVDGKGPYIFKDRKSDEITKKDLDDSGILTKSTPDAILLMSFKKDHKEVNRLVAVHVLPSYNNYSYRLSIKEPHNTLFVRDTFGRRRQLDDLLQTKEIQFKVGLITKKVERVLGRDALGTYLVLRYARNYEMDSILIDLTEDNGSM